MSARFRVARNPDPHSSLPYPIWLPVDGGLVVKAKETWPRAARVFCAQDVRPWDESRELLDDVGVKLCRRRGAAIDLILDRPKLSRSQFIFTNVRGRPAIWWQTQQTAQAPIREPEFQKDDPPVLSRSRWTLARSTAGDSRIGRSRSSAELCQPATMAPSRRIRWWRWSSARRSPISPHLSPTEASCSSCSVSLKSGAPQLWSKVIIPNSSGPSLAGAPGWETCSAAWRCAIRRCQSSLLAPENSLRSGHTDFSARPWVIAIRCRSRNWKSRRSPRTRPTSSPCNVEDLGLAFHDTYAVGLGTERRAGPATHQGSA